MTSKRRKLGKELVAEDWVPPPAELEIGGLKMEARVPPS